MATFVAVIAALLVPMVANASTVQLSGIVSGPTGKAISGATVSAVTIALGVPSTIATTTSNSSGEYSFAALSAGSNYSLHFAATSSTYAQYLGDTSDASSAQTITLTASGGSHTTINASLAAGGSIAGTVKSISHTALKGFTVRAYANGSDETVVRSGTSSSSGAYSITGLEPGQYQLEAIYTGANPPYGPAYSGGAATLDAASAIQAVAGTTAPYSFTLGKAGAIAGTITGETNSATQPLADVTVTPYLLNGTPPSSFNSASTLGLTPVVTDALGNYSIKGLAPGYYTLEFSPGLATSTDPVGGVPYAREMLGNGSSYEVQQGSPLHVVGGITLTGTDQELIRGGTVTVTVEDSVSDAPISNIQISLAHENQAADQSTDGLPTGITNGSGQYTFTGVGGGYYEAIIGSNLGTDGSITTYQREAVALSNQVFIGTTDNEVLHATLKVAGGLQPTATLTFGCCGSPPYKVGNEVGVDPYTTNWNPSDVDPSKDTAQWYRNGVAIPGATSNLYNLQAADAGQSITETITAYDLAYGSGSATTDPITVGNGTLYYYGGGGGVFGSETVGGTLTYSDIDGWSQAGVHETDVWQQSTDGGSTWPAMAVQPTHNTYVPVASDLGTQIRVEVTGSMAGYNTVTYDTPGEPIYQGQFTLLKQPKVTTTSTGWKATDGTWSPNDGTTVYEWVVTSHITGIPSVPSTITPQVLLKSQAQPGDFVGIREHRNPAGFTIYYSNLITARLGSAPTTTGTASIAGTAQYNTTLHAIVPTFQPPISTFVYQWQYKSGSTWKNESGATTSSYTPGVADIGRLLRVEITTSLDGFAAKTLTATETSAVAALALNNTVQPAISGTTGTGDPVSVSNGSWSFVPSAFSYHWLYSATGLAPFTTAPGSSNLSTYTIPQSLLNGSLEAQVTASLAGHSSGVATTTVHPVGKGQLTELTLPNVTLSGTTLTASGATFSPTATSVGYAWYYYGSDDSTLHTLGSLTTQSITGHTNDHLAVRALGTLTGYGVGNVTTGPLVLARRGTEAPTGTLSISGHTVGVPITSSSITWSITGSTVTYQWQYQSGSTWKSIPGATLQAYSPTGTYLGKTLRLLESASHTNYNTATATPSNTEVITSGAAPTPGAGLEVNGTNQVGDTLVASPGTWNPTTSTYAYSYQWQTSPNDSTWTNVSGATSSHFVVPMSAWLMSEYISVQITATKTGLTPGVTRIGLGQTSEGQVGLVKSPAVTVSGTTLTVSKGTWTNATSYHYQWQTVTPIGSTETPVGTDSNSYTPVPGDAGKAIIVTVTASGVSNYLDNSTIVLARSGGPITATAPITVTGTASTGSTLTASSSTFSVDSPDITWQWYRNGTAISGENNQTYDPAAPDIGKTLSVTLTVSEVGWTTEKFTATSGIIQSGTPVDNITDVSISGSPVVDGVLKASVVEWNEPGVTATYQWARGYVAIPGATHSTYTLTAADLDNDITVTVIGSKQFQAPAYTSSGSFTIGEGATLAPATAVKITGTPHLNDLLAATMGAWDFPVTLTYEWQYEAPAQVTWNDIPGASASKYTPTAADSIAVGGKIQLIVHATRPGHLPASYTSAAVTITP